MNSSTTSEVCTWDDVRFGDLLLGGTRNGVYKSKEFHGFGAKIVNMGELFSHPRLKADVEMRRVSLTTAELDKSGLIDRDLLFARRSLVASGAGKCSIVLEVTEPTTFESSLIRARLDPEAADSEFYYYFFNSPVGKQQLGTILRHVAVAGITGKDLENLRVPAPPLDRQREIAASLRVIDDKIELNRRMNATLEAMAKALFKSWFIDFDPVRAKLDGRQPPNLPPATAALFPEHLEESAIGKKPVGWEVATLETALSVLEVGGRPKGGVSGITSGIPSIGAESVIGVGQFDFGKTKCVPVEFYEGMKKGHVQSHDVLLYKDGGRPGEYEPHVSMFGDGFPFEKCSINEHVYRLRTNDLLGQEYLYFWLTSELPTAEMRLKGTGVAIPGLNSSAVRSLTVLIPPKPIVEAFTKQAAPLVTRILANANQSRTLATVRDTLLPKLLSGKLSIEKLDTE